MRNYIDKIVSEKSKVPKRRKFIYDTENFYDKEESGPCNAPNWTCTKYKGQLKSIIRNACNRRFGNELPIISNNNNTNRNKPENQDNPIQAINEHLRNLMPDDEIDNNLIPIYDQLE